MLRRLVRGPHPFYGVAPIVAEIVGGPVVAEGQQIPRLGVRVTEPVPAVVIAGKVKEIEERHRHRYEFNNTYRKEFEQAGMKCVGVNPETNLVEIVEVPSLSWYVGTQFHPEYSSTVLHPHPLFLNFIKAVIANKSEKKQPE